MIGVNGGKIKCRGLNRTIELKELITICVAKDSSGIRVRLVYLHDRGC